MNFKYLFLSMAFSAAAVSTTSLVARADVDNDCFTGWHYENQSCTVTSGKDTALDSLVIHAQSDRQYSEIDVYADGNFVSRVGVPGYDPSYPVYFPAELKWVKQVRLVFRGTVYLNGVNVSEKRFERSDRENHWAGVNQSNFNTPQGMADAAEAIVEDLQSGRATSDEDFEKYLKPIRIAALKMAASAGGRPYVSTKTGNKGESLVDAIEHADPYMDKLEEDSYYSDDVEGLLMIKEKIKSNYEF